MPAQERSFRTDAIILRRQDFGEADRLLLLLTPEHGKFRAIAKGTRKPIARKTGHVELFALVDMLIATGRELHLVTQAETKEPFLRLREDLIRGVYANHFVELLDRFTAEQDASQSEYTLLVNALSWLCEDSDPRLVARYYELALLNRAGFAPSLHQCGIGQEEIEPVDQYFSPFDGGVVCPEHYAGFQRGVPISLNALKTLRYLQTRPWDAVKVLNLPATLHLDLERLMLAYITYLLEQRLQSVEFLHRLRREAL
ncbi:MAG TPA: DNA repair protein RecO [Aggregatilineaceae bacterium]|nr:DNA repair protein RecO [Aggregatilineaceae bacterium]